MMDPVQPEASSDLPGDFFGADLGPTLIRACGGRLSDIQWFRTDWQRGGALTGYARYHGNGETNGNSRSVVVKLPVPPRELTWLERLQPDRHDAGQVVPRLHASGRTLDGYDLAWVVMERLPHGPLDGAWDGAEWDLLIDAAGRFYAAAAQYPADQPPREEDWEDLLKRSRRALRDHALPETQRWTAAIKTLKKQLKKMDAAWADRDIAQWCHGDLHLGNAMTHRPPPDGPAVVFDLAGVHAGHWVEDAVYLEHLFWSKPDRLGGRDVVKLINRQRKRHGLTADAHWPRLANIRRALRAAAAPAEQVHRPDPHHLHGALISLEKLLPRL